MRPQVLTFAALPLMLITLLGKSGTPSSLPPSVFDPDTLSTQLRTAIQAKVGHFPLRAAFVFRARPGTLPIGAQTTALPIHQAAERGDLGEVTRLVTQDPAAVRALDSYRNTPLHLAAAKGHLAVVDYLLGHGANPNAKNKAEDTPLYSAVLFDHPDVVGLLLTRGANINLGSYTGPAINTAALVGNSNVVRVLLDHGADPNAKNRTGDTPLHSAVEPKLRAGLRKTTIELLIARGADVDAKGDAGETPLHAAVETGDAEPVEILLTKGANVNATSVSGKTPLHAVSTKPWRAKRDIVALLLARHPNVNAKDVVGYTPLHMLAKMRLGLTAAEIRSNTHPMAAEARLLQADHAETARLLIASGALVGALDDRDATPLHWAAWSNSAAVADLLLGNGAQVNALDKLGETPLHEAAQEGSLEVADLLVRAGADLTIRDHVQRTPLGTALRNRKQAVADYLVAHGATQ